MARKKKTENVEKKSTKKVTEEVTNETEVKVTEEVILTPEMEEELSNGRGDIDEQ